MLWEGSGVTRVGVLLNPVFTHPPWWVLSKAQCCCEEGGLQLQLPAPRTVGSTWFQGCLIHLRALPTLARTNLGEASPTPMCDILAASLPTAIRL